MVLTEYGSLLITEPLQFIYITVSILVLIQGAVQEKNEEFISAIWAEVVIYYPSWDVGSSER